MNEFMRAQLAGLIVSAVVVIVGIVIVVVNSTSGGDSASFGWFAYQPLSGATITFGNVIALTPSMLLGAVLAVLGLLGLAFLVGLRLGSRSSTARS